MEGISISHKASNLAKYRVGKNNKKVITGRKRQFHFLTFILLAISSSASQKFTLRVQEAKRSRVRPRCLLTFHIPFTMHENVFFLSISSLFYFMSDFSRHVISFPLKFLFFSQQRPTLAAETRSSQAYCCFPLSSYFLITEHTAQGADTRMRAHTLRICTFGEGHFL